MNSLKEKYKSRFRKVEFDGCEIIVKVHPSKEWVEIGKKLAKTKDADMDMAVLISEHVLELDGSPIWTPEEIINDLCNDKAQELVVLIQEVNSGKKKAEIVNLKG